MSFDSTQAAARLSAELRFDSCTPNKGLLEKALEFDAATLDSLPDDTLAKFILVLAQYMVTLKYRENESLVRKIEYTRSIEVMSAQAIKNGSWKANTPLKQKLLEVSCGNEDVQYAMSQKEIADAELALLGGMVTVFNEYVNAYKREQTRRSLPGIPNSV